MPEPGENRSLPYQVFILVVCLYALAALAAQASFRLDPRTRGILEYADLAVCGLFLVDFGVCLARAPNRWKYFFTWGWLDLLSAIPMLGAARWGRLARVFRIFRVLRGVRAARLLATVVLRRRAENTFLAVSLAAMLLIVLSSVAVLHFETDSGSNIQSAEDAIWWAFATMTTVGYGDRFPVTTEGRIVATVLMCGGVGLFGTFSGLLAAWMLQPEKADNESTLEDLRKEIAALRQLMEAQAAGNPTRQPPE